MFYPAELTRRGSCHSRSQQGCFLEQQSPLSPCSVTGLVFHHCYFLLIFCAGFSILLRSKSFLLIIKKIGACICLIIHRKIPSRASLVCWIYCKLTPLMACLGKIRSKLGEVPSFLCACQVAPSWGYSLAHQLRRRAQPGGETWQEKETCREEQKFLKLPELPFPISVVVLNGKGDSLQGGDAGLGCERWMDTLGTSRGGR